MSDVVQPLLSVVVPVYGAEGRLRRLIAALQTALQGLDYELILVDDASRDKSWPLLSKIVSQQDTDRLQGLGLMRNMGQHRATFLGLCHGRGRYLATLDDDLQHPPAALRQMLKQAQAQDVEAIYGIDKQRRSPGSRVLGWLLCKMGVLPAEASSFRLMSAKLFERVRRRRCGYLFIEALIAAETTHIGYINIERQPRCEGRSGYSFLKKCKMSIAILRSYTSIFLWIGAGSGLLLLFCGHIVCVTAGQLLLAGTAFAVHYTNCSTQTAEKQIHKYPKRYLPPHTHADQLPRY